MDARISTPGGHPALYDALMWPLERAAIGEWRRRLAEAARGRVLEVGAGTGAQLRWYAPDAQVTALEPDDAMRQRMRRRAARAAARVTVDGGRAEELPLAGASFVVAVSTFALCTVSDPAAALAELRRVLVPGGPLLLLEHVHLPWQPGRSLQTAAAPAWAALTRGCRLDRDTLRSALDAGFDLAASRTHVAGWVVEAVLRAPSGAA